MASREVDLTEKRVFSDGFKSLFEHISLERQRYYRNQLSKLDESDSKSGLVLTGDSEERYYKRICSEEYSQLYCQRCGCLLKDKPYTILKDKDSMLCNRCLEDCGWDKEGDVYDKVFRVPRVKSAVIRIDGERKRKQ